MRMQRCVSVCEILSGGLLWVGALLDGRVAAAQIGADKPALEEITVTAQRREEKIQNVGIAINAFTGEQLANLGMTDSTDVARLSPGVSVSGTAGGQVSQFSIRGVTQNDFTDDAEAPVAVYVDETYVPNINGQIFGTFDLDRVEVLKGPQGTLFGRNATGGLVHFIPREPGKDLDGYVDLTYGRFNHVRAEAAAGIPVSDKLQVRVSVLENRFDPILKNVYPRGIGLPVGTQPFQPCCENLWNDDTQAGRVQLKYEATERLTLRLTGSIAHTRYSLNPYNAVATVPVFDARGRLTNVVFASSTETRTAIGPGGINVNTSGQSTSALRPTPGGDLFGFVAPNAQSLEISQGWARDDLNYSKAYDTALHINYKADSFDIVAISNYRRFDRLNGVNVPAAAENLIDYLTQSGQRSVSQEVRISGGDHDFRWVGGAYYLDIDSNVHSGFLAPTDSIFAGLLGFADTGIDLMNDFTLDKKTYSGFGQFDYSFASRWTAVLGGRVIRETQTYDFSSAARANIDNYSFSFGPALFPLQPSYTDKHTDTLWAGKAQLEYRPDTDLLLYVGVNRGVKGGGYNAKLPDGSAPLAPDQVRYKPETLLSYEGGLKSTALDGKLTVDASAYYYDYSNYQAFTFTNVSGVINNQQARTYGAEVSVNARPLSGLSLGFGASWVDARVKDLEIAPGIFRNVRPTFTPTTQVAGQVMYALPVAVAGGTVTIGGDVSWRDKMYANIRNFDGDVVSGYALANFRTFWLSAAGSWKISAGVDNAFDKRYRRVTFDLATLCGCNEESYGAPRWWNVSARYSF